MKENKLKAQWNLEEAKFLNDFHFSQESDPTPFDQLSPEQKIEELMKQMGYGDEDEREKLKNQIEDIQKKLADKMAEQISAEIDKEIMETLLQGRNK